MLVESCSERLSRSAFSRKRNAAAGTCDPGSVGVVTEQWQANGAPRCGAIRTRSASMLHRHRNRHRLDSLAMQADVVVAGRERVG